jgi:16S rRNA (guanine527-N7)-methyltransferase
VKINSYESFCSHLYVSRETYEKFEIYYETLLKWQKSINLISNSTIGNIWVRHFLDSAQLYDFTKNISGNILDLGSGAGFPGLILAMMGNKNICVIESDQKKCTFIREVAMLSDTNIKIYNTRIEDLSFFKPNLITSRALAPLNKLIKYVENYMAKSPSNSEIIPKLLFLKGKFYKDELLELCKIRNIDYKVYQSITDEFGKIVYINKVNVLNIKNEKKNE